MNYSGSIAGHGNDCCGRNSYPFLSLKKGSLQNPENVKPGWIRHRQKN